MPCCCGATVSRRAVPTVQTKIFGAEPQKTKCNNFLDELLGKDFGCGMRQKRILRYIARIKLRHKDFIALGCRGGFQ